MINLIDKETRDLILNLEKRVERLERESKYLELNRKRAEMMDYYAPKSPTDIETNEIRQTVDGKVYVSLLSGPAIVFDLKTAKLIRGRLSLVIDRIEA